MKDRLKQLFLLAGFLGCSGLLALEAPFCRVSGDSTVVGTISIVVPEKYPLVNFAAEELQVLLKEAGNLVQPAQTVTQDALCIVLGDSDLARAAGVSLEGVPRDGYRIVKKGNLVFISGKDSKAPRDFVKGDYYLDMLEVEDYATLLGVYEFLERFAGVRFYFPGKMGTIVPQKPLALPETIDLLDYPAMINRMVGDPGKWYDDVRIYANPKKFPGNAKLAKMRYRHRILLRNMSNSLQTGGYINRFLKTNPEYFAMGNNGKRIPEHRNIHHCQFCLHSGIEQEIFADIKAFAQGLPPSARNIPPFSSASPNRWPTMFSQGQGIVNLTHDDSFVWCSCPVCAKIADAAQIKTDLAQRQKVSNEVWKFTARIAERLKAENIDTKVFMLAYYPYNEVPDFPLPDNIVTAVVLFPGIQGHNASMDQQDALLNAWRKKTGSKILLRAWTGKYNVRAFPGIPAFCHNLMGQYFSQRSDWFSGAFCYEGADNFIFSYLNVYVFSKMAWDPRRDYKAMLDEHFDLMFGPAAAKMRQYFDEMEKIWDQEIMLGLRETVLGGVFQVAQPYDLWRKVFSQSRRDRFNAIFDEAEALAANAGDSLERVRFMRKNVWDSVLAQAKEFDVLQDAVKNFRLYVPGDVYLRPHFGTENEVQTIVSVSETPDSFIFKFHCEEPRITEIRAEAKGRDNGTTWMDFDAEVFLNPSGDEKNYLQWIANDAGALDDYAFTVNEPSLGIRWNGNAKVETKRGPDYWECVFDIPKSDLGDYCRDGFPVMFYHKRAFNNMKDTELVTTYKWSCLSSKILKDPTEWGRIVLTGQDENLVVNGTFKGLEEVAQSRKTYREMKTNPDKQSLKFDHKQFIRDGVSLHISSQEVGSVGVELPIDVSRMKPGTKYRMSFFCRTQKLDGLGVWGEIHWGKGVLSSPFKEQRIRVFGDNPWHRLSYVITSPETLPQQAYMHVRLMRGVGEVWIDDCRLEEVK